MAKTPKENQDAAAYAEYLRRGTASALADTRPALSNEELEAYMDAIRFSHLAQLDEMMRQKGRSK